MSRICGPTVAKEIIYTAKRFNGKEAERLRIVSKSVDGNELMKETVELAKIIGKNAPLGCAAAKKVIDMSLECTFDEHVKYSNSLRFPLAQTNDYKEALKAYGEKRKPVFVGN